MKLASRLVQVLVVAALAGSTLFPRSEATPAGDGHRPVNDVRHVPAHSASWAQVFAAAGW